MVILGTPAVVLIGGNDVDLVVRLVSIDLIAILIHPPLEAFIISRVLASVQLLLLGDLRRCDRGTRCGLEVVCGSAVTWIVAGCFLSAWSRNSQDVDEAKAEHCHH